MKLTLPKNYNEAVGMLNGRYEKKVGYHTYLTQIANETIAVMHYRTPIVIFFPTTTLFWDCSYMSQSTKKRINMVYGKRLVYHKNWVLYCTDPNAKTENYMDKWYFAIPQN